MTKLTLLTRFHVAHRLNQIDYALKLMLKGLDVEVKIVGTAPGRWVQIALSGEDKGVATRYLAKEIGFCPTIFGNLAKFSTLKGYIVPWGKTKEELQVDIGVFQPKTVHATIPLIHLQAQLIEGRKASLRKLSELYGFCGDWPLNIRLTNVNEKTSRIYGELSTWQVAKYRIWREALLDRLLVLGVVFSQVKSALDYVKLDRDVINVEPLGVFEHVLTCKLGTDAAGLIPKIGRILKNAKFALFNPRRIIEFLRN